MPSETTNRHYLPARLHDRAIRILLVGCGGNGAQMLMGLASLDTALRAISSRSLDVTVVDDDVVTHANLGRQPFYPCDVGRSKAHTLTERINIAHGLAWTAVHGRAPRDIGPDNIDLLISCVDAAAARRVLGSALDRCRTMPAYWMDLGNRAADGQFILGCPSGDPHEDSGRLPTVLEAFPELADETRVEDDAPSCSVAEALEGDAHELLARLSKADRRITSPLAIWETVLAVARILALDIGKAQRAVADFCRLVEIEIQAVPVNAGPIAIDAFARFGKGRHPAALHFGDCFAYACARTARQPLLYKGEDFPLTDIETA